MTVDRLCRTLGATLFSVGMVVATVVWAPVVLLAYPLPLHWRFWVATRWVAFLLPWLRLTCRVGYRLEGLENIPSSPCVILSKHQSTLETLVLPMLFRPMAIVLKRELLWVPFFGWALGSLKPVAIDRSAGNSAMRQVAERGVRALHQGQWMLLFPEGTRTSPGQRRRYKLGGAMLACEAGVPVLPVAHNAGQHWGKRAFLKKPGTVRFVIGPPIETAGRSPLSVMKSVEDWVEATVSEISGLPIPAAAVRGSDQ